METRANYVLIGAFTLLGLLAGLGFFLWLARIEFERQFDYYDILFDNVSGLGRGGEVRFNGVNVGQVVSFDFDPEDMSLVRVRIEVRGGTPVTVDTEATLQLQGVTGVSFVALTSDAPAAPLLREAVPDPIPTIRGQPSRLDILLGEAPDLLSESLVLLRDLSAFTGPANQAYVQEILQNFAQASGRLDEALDDFSQISQRVALATEVLAAFTAELQPIAEQTGEMAARAEEALAAATGAFAEAETAIASANALIAARLPGLIDQAEATMADIGDGAREVATELAAAAAAAAARLDEAEATVARAEEALGQTTASLRALEAAAVSIDALVAGDGAALVAESRAAVALASETLAGARLLATEDMPRIVADIRGATETVDRVAAQVGEDISRLGTDVSALSSRLGGLAGEVETALGAATDAFRAANTTLTAVDQALASAERTLAVTEATFAGAGRVIDEDLDGIIADLRSSARALEASLTEVSADVPEITRELRETIATAGAAMAGLNAAVSRSAPPVQAFAENGLVQFTRLMQEARSLVGSLERLSARIERDPARFFLGAPASEYRR